MIKCVSCGYPYEPSNLAAYKGSEGICKKCLSDSVGEGFASSLLQIAESAKNQSEKELS